MTDSSMTLRLYVAGDSQNSLQAIANLTSFCREHLAGWYQIEIVDVLRQPQRALDDGILLTPTLLIPSAGAPRTLVGNLAKPHVLREALLLTSRHP